MHTYLHMYIVIGKHQPEQTLMCSSTGMETGPSMEMTEHIYGIWKRRFPIAENLRNHLPNAIKIINATAILHNISILWEEIGIDQLDGQPDPADVPALPAEPDMHVDFDPNDLNPLQMRQLGQATRDNMRL